MLLTGLPRRMVTWPLVLPNIHCNIWIHRRLVLYNERMVAITSVHGSVSAVWKKSLSLPITILKAFYYKGERMFNLWACLATSAGKSSCHSLMNWAPYNDLYSSKLQPGRGDDKLRGLAAKPNKRSNNRSQRQETTMEGSPLLPRGHLYLQFNAVIWKVKGPLP